MREFEEQEFKKLEKILQYTREKDYFLSWIMHLTDGLKNGLAGMLF